MSNSAVTVCFDNCATSTEQTESEGSAQPTLLHLLGAFFHGTAKVEQQYTIELEKNFGLFRCYHDNMPTVLLLVPSGELMTTWSC
jgi:hypothetical protein